MDPIHYDRIADLLCQIRAKMENNLNPRTKQGQDYKEDYIKLVCNLLLLTDKMAIRDQNRML